MTSVRRGSYASSRNVGPTFLRLPLISFTLFYYEVFIVLTTCKNSIIMNGNDVTQEEALQEKERAYSLFRSFHPMYLFFYGEAA